MKYLYKLSIFLLILPLSVFSQGENDNWYFGDQAAVNFSSSNPIAVSGSQMATGEGVASISDSSGQLLFYTDGRRVWNRNHQIMANGTSLTSSGNDATQGVVIIPFPNHPNEYFIFTTNGGAPLPGQTQYNFMAYSKVDMNQNNGLGDIVELNTPLKDHNGSVIWQGKVEAITAINNNNENYWVVLPFRSHLLSYYVDENGVNTTPVESAINFVTHLVSGIKISPNHQLLSISEYSENQNTLYYFDDSTGQVVSSQPLGYFIVQGGSGNLGIYSAEFSSQNNVYWLSIYSDTYKRVYGFDLNNLSAAPIFLQSTSPTYNFFGTLQRGIDDELYLASLNHNYLIKINNSNDLNNAILDEYAVFLGGNQSKLGLPQLVPILESSCSENLVLNSPETNSIFSYEVSNNITTLSNYVVSSQNITLSAGNSINLLPNTIIESGSIFLAKIEGCSSTLRTAEPQKKDFKTQTIYIDLNSETETIEELSIYPNPVSNGKIYITTKENLTKEIEIFDVLGKKIYSTSLFGKELNISKLTPGIYILKIKENTSSATRKLVVR